MKQLSELFLSVKAAAATAGLTISSAVGLIPDPINKLAALVGVVLSLIMCGYWRAQTKKIYAETEKINLEREKLQRELKGGE